MTIGEEVALQQVGRPQTLQESVYDMLRQSILSGVMKPGRQLRQRDLAKQLGVSTMPVREALRRLQAEGLVAMSWRGAVVSVLRAQEIEELYLVRTTLECLATELAVPCLGAEDLRELRRLFAAMEQARQTQDNATYMQLDGQLHSTLYRACGRPLLTGLITSLWERSRVYRQMYIHQSSGMEEPQQHHAAILAACERGDVASATQKVRLNLETSARALVRELTPASG